MYKSAVFGWIQKIKGKQAGTNNGNLRKGQVAVAIRGI
jgi:hypothetical protein